MSLTKTSYSMISGAPANVLDFGADPTGVADSTAAFNLAIAANRSIFIPDGTYTVSDVGTVEGLEVTGNNCRTVLLQVGTNGSGAFTYASGGTGNGFRFSNFTVLAKSGVTNAIGFKQTNKALYTAYAVFDNIETYANLEIAYDGFYIYTLWNVCRDGYKGSPVGGQTHQAIKSVPTVYDPPQNNQTNINRVVGCVFNQSSVSTGAIEIAYGTSWFFKDCGFEALSTRALHISGVFNIKVEGCWFEGITATSAILLQSSPGPNTQNTNPVEITNCFALLNGLTTSFITAGSISGYGVRYCFFSAGSAGLVLAAGTYANVITTLEANTGNAVAGFFDGFLATQTDTILSASVIPTASTQNINVLPIGPTGLTASNFTNVGFTSITNVTSTIGVGDSVRFVFTAVGSAAYYTMPAKLVTFLQGKKITFSALGYGSAGGTELLRLAIWDSVASPTYLNATTSSAGISSGTANLQTSYLTYTVGVAATSLKIGFWAGGNANGESVYIESGQLLLGTATPTSTGLH
jgi:hypothetical protein